MAITSVDVAHQADSVCQTVRGALIEIVHRPFARYFSSILIQFGNLVEINCIEEITV